VKREGYIPREIDIREYEFYAKHLQMSEETYKNMLKSYYYWNELLGEFPFSKAPIVDCETFEYDTKEIFSTNKNGILNIGNEYTAHLIHCEFKRHNESSF
jgi:hypothetical protein